MRINSGSIPKRTGIQKKDAYLAKIKLYIGVQLALLFVRRILVRIKKGKPSIVMRKVTTNAIQRMKIILLNCRHRTVRQLINNRSMDIKQIV